MLKQHELDKVARTVLQENDRGGYTVPTDALYPYQWNWDSAFAALGFSEFCQRRRYLVVSAVQGPPCAARVSGGFSILLVHHLLDL